MSDQIKFCYRCGANLPEGSVFCPECGFRLESTGQPESLVSQTPPTVKKKSPLGPVPIMILIYGILAIVGGISSILVGFSIDALIQMMDELYVSGQITYEDLQTFKDAIYQFGASPSVVFLYTGCLMLSSGIFAVVSGAKANNLKDWKISFWCCIAASVLPIFLIPYDLFSAIILPIVGFLMCYQIYKYKDSYSS